MGLAFGEGAVVLGMLTYLAAALETSGVGAAVAGAVVAAFGLSVLAASRASGHAARRWRMSTVMGLGAGGYALAYYIISFAQPVVGVLACALVLGGSWALMHPLVQSWATDVVPKARASAVSLFSMSLFLGSAVSAAVVAPWAGARRFNTIFLGTALFATALAIVAVTGRHGYAGD